MNLDEILCVFQRCDLDTKMRLTLVNTLIYNRTKKYVNKSVYAAILGMDYYSLIRLNNYEWTSRIDVLNICSTGSIPLLKRYLKYRSTPLDLGRIVYEMRRQGNITMVDAITLHMVK